LVVQPSVKCSEKLIANKSYDILPDHLDGLTVNAHASCAGG